MDVIGLDHVALHVSDLAASRYFYGTILGLSEEDRPDFDFPGAWYRVGGNGQQIHLIDRAIPADSPPPRERHLALGIGDPTSAELRLKVSGQTYRGPKPRPDGALQIFVRDPDGHVIELLGPIPR